MPMKELFSVDTPLLTSDFLHRKDRLPRLDRWATVEKEAFSLLFPVLSFFSPLVACRAVWESSVGEEIQRGGEGGWIQGLVMRAER
jgi:hypothetical protein